MPTYEYACSSCGNAWEEIQRITEPAVELCPACKKATAKRQISGGTFILKGGGWYSDLYSSSPKKAPAKDEASASSGESGKSDKGDKSDKSESKDTKAETKSETKSEPKKDSGTPAASGSGSSGSSTPAKTAAQ